MQEKGEFMVKGPADQEEDGGPGDQKKIVGEN